MTQSQSFIELSNFSDLARFVCAFREYPLRVYSNDLNGIRVISSGLTLANTILWFYTPMIKYGRYLSYRASAGKEYCDIVESTKDISVYAPIIHMESEILPLPINLDITSDIFHPIRVKDMGSLVRLTYDPELPDERNLTLFAIPYNNSWVMGYITSLEMDSIYYQFNYVKLDSQPSKPFIKYQGNEGKDPEFSDIFEHGFSYLPIIKIKSQHDIFGFDRRKIKNEHKPQVPNVMEKIMNIHNKNRKLPRVKIMIRPKELYYKDINQEISVDLVNGRLRSREELAVEIKRQIPLFLEIINKKRSSCSEPKVNQKQVTVSTFIQIEDEEFDIVNACEIYISVLKRILIETREEIKKIIEIRQITFRLYFLPNPKISCCDLILIIGM